MKLLELFSGNKSVGQVAEQLGYEVTSLGLKNAASNCDTLNWNYTVYESGYFDVIWASPPCTEYSCAKTVGIRDIEKVNDIVFRTIEIRSPLDKQFSKQRASVAQVFRCSGCLNLPFALASRVASVDSCMRHLRVYSTFS